VGTKKRKKRCLHSWFFCYELSGTCLEVINKSSFVSPPTIACQPQQWLLLLFYTFGFLLSHTVHRRSEDEKDDGKQECHIKRVPEHNQVLCQEERRGVWERNSLNHTKGVRFMNRREGEWKERRNIQNINRSRRIAFANDASTRFKKSASHEEGICRNTRGALSLFMNDRLRLVSV
jgi:hypothetical protein